MLEDQFPEQFKQQAVEAKNKSVASSVLLEDQFPEEFKQVEHTFNDKGQSSFLSEKKPIT